MRLLIVFALVGCKKDVSTTSEKPVEPPGPRDALVVADAAIDAAVALPAPKGTLLIVSTKPGEPALQIGGDKLEGMRVELFGTTGKLCDATVGAATIATCKVTTVALATGGACAGAIYARAPGDPLAVVMPAPATRQQTAAAEKWFEDEPYRMANENVELNELDSEFLPDVTSIQTLTPPGRRGMTLISAEAAGRYRRRLYVRAWSDDRGSDIDDVGADVVATQPTRVLGADVDGDGATDAVVSHAQGAALVYGADKRPLMSLCD